MFSRAGVTTTLTPFDVAALRFMVAGLLVLPFAKAWWPENLPWYAICLISLCGPGAIYTLYMYFGLSWASAAYGGVFANGSIPIFAVLLGFWLRNKLPKRDQLFAIAIIVLGCGLLGWRGMIGGGQNVALGILLFLSASYILAVYIFCLDFWKVTPKQALLLVNLPNAVFFLPIWYFLLPSGIEETEWDTILFQAAFQGLGPGYLAVICFTLAALFLGSTMTAVLSAMVPVTAAILAIPVLGEIPNTIEWAGIVVATVGLGIMVLRRSPETAPDK